MNNFTIFIFLVILLGTLCYCYRIHKLLLTVLELLKPVVPDAVIKFYTIINGRKEEVKNMFLPISKKLPLAIAIADLKGNPAKVDGVPQWALSDSSLALLEVAEDGMSAMVVPVGPLGLVKVQVKADADLGEGVKELLGEMDVEMIAGEAVSLVVSAGEPVDI